MTSLHFLKCLKHLFINAFYFISFFATFPLANKIRAIENVFPSHRPVHPLHLFSPSFLFLELRRHFCGLLHSIHHRTNTWRPPSLPSQRKQQSLCSEMGEELRFALRCQGSRQRPTLRRSCLRCTPPSHTYVPTNHDVPPLHGVRVNYYHHSILFLVFIFFQKFFFKRRKREQKIKQKMNRNI